MIPQNRGHKTGGNFIQITLLLALAFLLPAAPAWAQNPTPIEKLFLEGIALQEEGKARAALKKFEKILDIDPNHIPAISEKTYALMVLHRYRPVLDITEKVLRQHKGSPQLLFIYINRGNAFSYIGKPQEALEVFDEGIAAFPTSNLLYFNKGLTLAELGKRKEAQDCFEKAVSVDPEEPSAHLAIAHLALSNGQRVPALLAFARFLVLEPEGKRAKNSVQQIKKLIKANPDVLEKLPADSAQINKENDFTEVEKILMYPPVRDTESAKQMPPIERAMQRFSALCCALRAHQQEGTGFFWTYYAPYFIEMQDLDLLLPFTHVVLVSDGNKPSLAWIKENDKELGRFFAWSEIYPWQK